MGERLRPARLRLPSDDWGKSLGQESEQAVAAMTSPLPAAVLSLAERSDDADDAGDAGTRWRRPRPIRRPTGNGSRAGAAAAAGDGVRCWRKRVAAAASTASQILAQIQRWAD